LRDIFGKPLGPQPPRPLTDRELRGLVLMGFPDLAVRAIQPPCENCGERLSGASHAMNCRFPKKADRHPEQPWQAKCSTRS